MPRDAQMQISLFRNSDNFRTCQAGDIIFRQGEVGSEMFAIRKSRVELRLGDKVLDTLDGPAHVYLNRISTLKSSSPGSPWVAALELTEK